MIMIRVIFHIKILKKLGTDVDNIIAIMFFIIQNWNLKRAEDVLKKLSLSQWKKKKKKIVYKKIGFNE